MTGIAPSFPGNPATLNLKDLCEFMAENTESDTLKDYPDLCEIVIDAVVWRMAHGAEFTDRELDHLNRDNLIVEQICDRLADAEYFRFLGLIRDHQERLAVRYQKACRSH